MHPRNHYADASATDFGALAERFEELYPYIREDNTYGSYEHEAKVSYAGETKTDQFYTLRFAEPKALKTLTETFLKRDFKLKVDLRDDRLCPPVPNRYEYVLFLQDLLAAQEEVRAKLAALNEEYPERSNISPPAQGKRRKLSDEGTGGEPSMNAVLALDIGTGASLIYPLLACCADAAPDGKCPTVPPSKWHFVATDIDAGSVQHAEKILEEADILGDRELPSRIAVVLTGADWTSSDISSTSRLSTQRLIPAASELRENEKCSALLEKCDRNDPDNVEDIYDVTMCNPPFYASQDEMRRSASLKEYAPFASCTGTQREMVYSGGGEVGFVTRMIKDSIKREGDKRSDKGHWQRWTWYTSLLGFRTSIPRIVEILQQHKINNYVTISFTVGKTTRCIIAWNCGPIRLQGAFSQETTFGATYAKTYHSRLHMWKSLAVKGDSTRSTLVVLPDALDVKVVRATAAQHLEAVLRSVEGIHWMQYEGEPSIAESSHMKPCSYTWLICARQNRWNSAGRRRSRREGSEHLKKKGVSEDGQLEARPDKGKGKQTAPADDRSSGPSTSSSPQKQSDRDAHSKKMWALAKSHLAQQDHKEASPEKKRKADTSKEGSPESEKPGRWMIVVELTLSIFKPNDQDPEQAVRLQSRWIYGTRKRRGDFESLCKCISDKLVKTPMIPPSKESKESSAV